MYQKVLNIGIMSFEDYKKRSLAIACHFHCIFLPGGVFLFMQKRTHA